MFDYYREKFGTISLLDFDQGILFRKQLIDEFPEIEEYSSGKNDVLFDEFINKVYFSNFIKTGTDFSDWMSSFFASWDACIDVRQEYETQGMLRCVKYDYHQLAPNEYVERWKLLKVMKEYYPTVFLFLNELNKADDIIRYIFNYTDFC